MKDVTERTRGRKTELVSNNNQLQLPQKERVSRLTGSNVSVRNSIMAGMDIGVS